MTVAGPVALAYPFRGRWRVQNSPANRVPSHGTRRFALDHAIDLLPLEERGRRGMVGPSPAACRGTGRSSTGAEALL